MKMKRARLEDLSLIFHLRNMVFSKEFYIPRVKDSLVSLGGDVYQIKLINSSPLMPNPFQRGRGLYFYDKISTPSGIVVDNSQEQSSIVTVYDIADSVLSNTDYKIDYKNGKVTRLNGAAPAKISYEFPYVAVLDAYEENRESDKLDLPFIAVETSGQEPLTPLEIGGGKITDRVTKISVYAKSTSERDDIVQTLLDNLEERCCMLIDFNLNGFPLNYDGTFNSDFIPVQLEKSSRIFFEKVTNFDVPGTRDFTYGERYKSVVSLSMRVYNSRDSV